MLGLKPVSPCAHYMHDLKKTNTYIYVWFIECYVLMLWHEYGGKKATDQLVTCLLPEMDLWSPVLVAKHACLLSPLKGPRLWCDNTLHSSLFAHGCTGWHGTSQMVRLPTVHHVFLCHICLYCHCARKVLKDWCPPARHLFLIIPIFFWKIEFYHWQQMSKASSSSGDNVTFLPEDSGSPQMIISSNY